ncbi:MAG: ChaN family lipoprotein [Syntrophobacteraceae bacterium]
MGETHTSVQDHKTQLKILRQLAERWPCIELGMEMFPRAAQPVLDRYIKGEMSEEEFLNESHWEQVWGFPFGLYRGLLDFAKERRIRVAGLNAPQKIVRKIAHNGLASLTLEERMQVAREFHLDDAKNRLRIQKEFTGHVKEGIQGFDSFFEAQLGWEETMAETLAERLEQKEGKCRIVVVVGKGHMTERHGVPYLTALRKPHEYRTVAPVPINYPFGTVDPDLADYVVITDVVEPFHRPRLGVSIQAAASGSGVEILGVSPDSPAARANLRKGDIILSIDGSPVKSVEEVQRAVAERGPVYRILIERGMKQIRIDVTIK